MVAMQERRFEDTILPESILLERKFKLAGTRLSVNEDNCRKKRTEE